MQPKIFSNWIYNKPVLLLVLSLTLFAIKGFSQLPPATKQLIESSIENWNMSYGTNVKAIGWTYEGVIKNDVKLKQVTAEITSPSAAWLPDGDYEKASGITARRIADEPSITKAQLDDWANKIKGMIRTGFHIVRIKWTKAAQSFSTLCITDNNTIVYDNMFSNMPMIEHHSKCLDYRIGWAWQKGFANLTRGSITADLTVTCTNGVPSCGNSCTASMTFGDAKISCIVTTTGPCCKLTWAYGWATGFRTVTINPVTLVVTISNGIGSSGSGSGSCTECCPPVVSTTPALPASSFLNGPGRDSLKSPALKTISVKTISGEVVDVRVPNMIMPGEKISGSTAAKTQSSTLEGMVIEIDGKQSNSTGKSFSFLVPAAVVSIPFLLKDKNGMTIGATELPVITPGIPQPGGTAGHIPSEQIPSTPSHAPGNFVPINYCQPGQPLIINGDFDGDATDTHASINNVPCEVIAESPRGSIIQVPENLPAGQATISIQEGPAKESTHIQVVTLDLSANKTVLRKGQKATVTVKVSGLEGLDLNNNNFYIELNNGSPSVIQFRDINSTTLTRNISSSNVKNGVFSFTTDVTGITTGSYTISSNLTSNTAAGCWQKYKDCLARCEAQEKKCYEDCDKNNGGFGCYLACSAAARLCEAACFEAYLECLKQLLH